MSKVGTEYRIDELEFERLMREDPDFVRSDAFEDVWFPEEETTGETYFKDYSTNGIQRMKTRLGKK